MRNFEIIYQGAYTTGRREGDFIQKELDFHSCDENFLYRSVFFSSVCLNCILTFSDLTGKIVFKEIQRFREK